MIELFTVVTLCYERKVFLKRYMIAAHKSGFNYLVVDGSSDAYDGFMPDNVLYFHMPGAEFIDRLAFALDNVSSPYTVLLADDDFIVPSTLLKGVEVLHKNPDYVSVQGRVLTFNESYDKSSILYKSYEAFDNPSFLLSESPKERVSEHLNHYIFTIYSVQKTFIWRRFLDTIYPGLVGLPVFNCTFPSIFELSQSIHCIMSGKNMMLDDLYLMRESFPRPKEERQNANLYFNETEEFNDYVMSFSELLKGIFPEENINYFSLLHDAFHLYAKKRREQMSEEGAMTKGCSVNELVISDEIQSEFRFIENIVASHRGEVLKMFQKTGLQNKNYWPDAIWRREIATKYYNTASSLNHYVIFGVGQHTQDLAKAVGLVGNIRGVVDSNSKLWGRDVLGLKCYSPDAILTLSANVIISSQEYENEIADLLTTRFGAQIKIFKLYTDDC
jgi:glycosyltransferase domain-containing protein